MSELWMNKVIKTNWASKSQNHLVVQWLRLCAPKSRGTSMLPGHKITILHGTAKKKGSSCLASELESYKKKKK